MRIRLMIATATTAALLAGAAFAQPSPSTGDTAVNPPASSDQLPAGVAAGNAATTLSTPSGQAGADAASVAPAAGAPAERTSANAGTEVVSNGPIPDTRANRAKYGAPLSTAGRLTKPAGN